MRLNHMLGLGWLAFAGPLAAAERAFDFTEAPTNQTPPGCFSTVAGEGQPGVWRIRQDDLPLALPRLSPNAPGTFKQAVVAQLARDATDEHFPLLILGDETYGDFTLTTRFKIVDGLTEQMAGIAFRIQDEKNFYVARASSLGGTFYFYKFEKGVRFPPVGNNLAIEKGVWHTLTVECKATSIHLLLDGREAMPTINDPTFSRGKIGFWTKSDSITYFTGARIVYTPREPFVQSLVNDAMKQHNRLLLGLRISMVPAKSTEPRLVASDREQDIGQPGESTDVKVINQGVPYYRKEKDVVTVTLPLRDRNGDSVAAVRVVMKSFPGQTEENAVVRAMPIVKAMQQRASAVDSLLE